MDIVNMLVTLVSGAVGGNAAGAAMPDKSLGALGNSIAGIFGGGIGTYILQALGLFAQAAAQPGAATGPESFDIAHLIANVAASGVGGAALTTIVGLIKNAMNKS